mgnify:CR=1 FL=1
MRRRLIRTAVLAVLTLAAAGLYFADALTVPHAGFDGEILLVVERGTSSRELAALLARRGVIRDEWRFLAVRALRREAVLQAGEYQFSRPASAWAVFDRFVRGDVYLHHVTMPEGATVFDVARILARLDWIGPGEAEQAVRDAALIRDLDPVAETLEGYLFPSTYFVSRGTSAARICGTMVRQFRTEWKRLAGEGNVREVVTLASLVERETGVAEERKLVASVFRNRLRRGIKLQCDPTVIYAALLEERYDGVINRSDLDSPHPYNTYRHAGLPPGPITSPGAAALDAAIRPAETDYLFFVAKPGGSGGHEFSKTLAAHNRAVARYRRGVGEASRQGQADSVSGAEASGAGN